MSVLVRLTRNGACRLNRSIKISLNACRESEMVAKE